MHNIFNNLYYQFGEMRDYELIRHEDTVTYYRADFRINPYTLAFQLDGQKKIRTFRLTEFKDTTDLKKSNFFYKYPNGDELWGTLTQPKGTQPIPAVIIIPGSGPTDRNGNSPLGVKANTYKMLADSLAAHNIACLRYDKRGVGENASLVGSEDSVTFGAMIKDAARLSEHLKKYWRFNKVIVLGHSEGSLIGMEVAAEVKAAGYISVSGVGERADKVIEKQLHANSKTLAKEAKPILDSLDAGYHVKDIDPKLFMLFRPSVQNYMCSWLKYDPGEEIKKLDMPVLIIQGTTDLQVGVKEAKKLHKAKPDATLTLIKGMNHVLKPAPKDKKENAATYTNPDLPLSPELIPAITGFINGLK